MTIPLTSEIKESKRSVAISCPSCEARQVLTEATDREEKFILLHFIPVGTSRITLVKCTECGVMLISDIKAQELAVLLPPDAKRHLFKRISPVLWSLLIFNPVAAFLPGVGVLTAGLGLKLGWKYRGWVRAVLVTEAIAAMAMSGAAFYYLVVAPVK